METIGDSGLKTRENTGHVFKNFFFVDLFNNEKRAIELFNLFENRNLPENTKVFLCGEKLSKLIALRNDLAFIVEDKFIVVCEHQSTINANMPLRILQYFTNILYTLALGKGSVYGTELIGLPTPKFYVVYNGKNAPGDKVLRLSDAYFDKSSGYSLELEAQIFDIGYNRFFNTGQAAACYKEKNSNIFGYSFLVHEIHLNLDGGMKRDKAILTAVEKCVQEDILTEYFMETGLEEVLKMLDFEYTLEDEIEYRAQEAMRKGHEKGLEKGRKEGREKGREEGKEETLTEVVG